MIPASLRPCEPKDLGSQVSVGGVVVVDDWRLDGMQVESVIHLRIYLRVLQSSRYRTKGLP